MARTITDEEIKLYIVGPNEPNQKDLKFIKAIKSNLKIYATIRTYLFQPNWTN